MSLALNIEVLHSS